MIPILNLNSNDTMKVYNKAQFEARREYIRFEFLVANGENELGGNEIFVV